MLLEWLPVQEPHQLWEKYWNEMCEDFLWDKQAKREYTSAFALRLAKSKALRELRDMCQERGLDPNNYLPLPDIEDTSHLDSRAFQREMEYDRDSEQTEFERLIAMIKQNPDQLQAWEAIQEAWQGGPAK